MDIITCTDHQNYEKLSEMLVKSHYKQEELDSSFEIAVGNGNIKIIKLIVEYKPSINLINKIFVDHVYLGIYPEIIYLLQNMCSVQLLAKLHRENSKNKSMYLVGPIEEDIIKDIDKLKKPCVSIIEKLKNQKKINEYLLDAYFSNYRFITYKLSQFNHELTGKPSQHIINIIFTNAINDGNYSFAEMLIINNLGPEMSTIGSIFENSVISCDFKVVEWFFSNKMGIRPNLNIIYRSYESIMIEKYQTDKKISNNHELRTMVDRINTEEIIYIVSQMIKIISVLENQIDDGCKEKIKIIIRNFEQHTSRVHRAFIKSNNMEIHGYSRITVDLPVSNNNLLSESIEDTVIVQQPSRQIHSKKTLNQSIIECLKKKNQGKPRLTEDQILGQLRSIIVLYIHEVNHASAFSKIGQLLNNSTLEQFEAVIIFLKNYYPYYIETWLKGFLEESINEHSCYAGAIERIITGLRGIEDIELNNIFVQAEGPQLLRIFMREGMNIFGEDKTCKKNLDRIVDILKCDEIKNNTPTNIIKKCLEKYIKNEISSLGLEISTYYGEAEIIVDLIVDSFDTHLKHLL